MTPEPDIEEVRAYCQQTVERCVKEANDLKASNQQYIAENAKLREALQRGRDWGISSKGYSASESIKLADWVDGGMSGPLAPLPDYYPKA